MKETDNHNEHCDVTVHWDYATQKVILIFPTPAPALKLTKEEVQILLDGFLDERGH